MGTCGYGEELSGSINAGNFLTSGKVYWLASQEGLTMLPAGGRQHRGCIIPQAVTHSLVLLKMGKLIARKMFC